VHRTYLAGPYSWKLLIAEHSRELERLGYTITSEWLTQEVSFTKPDNSTDTGKPGLHAECAKLSTRDLRNIVEADTLVLFEPGVPLERNTRVAEFGAALVLGKQCVVIGPEDEDKKDILSNIFVMLRDKPKTWGEVRWNQAGQGVLDGIKPVIHFQTWDQFLEDVAVLRPLESWHPFHHVGK
jgi:hypothetical protein